MTYLFIAAIISIAIGILFISLKGAPLIEEEQVIVKKTPKFEPRKVTDLSKKEINVNSCEQEKPVEIPKKKNYKKRIKRSEK
jgi:hypothetical protein